jgi:hypothetical protein
VNNTFGVKGVQEYCQFFKSIEDASALRRRISECFERAALPYVSRICRTCPCTALFTPAVLMLCRMYATCTVVLVSVAFHSLRLGWCSMCHCWLGEVAVAWPPASCVPMRHPVACPL